ncbi:hypothetical protein [Limnoglobus roseus]|uniref:Uncharacterized protein n=1 Tax=Limnoglobus roseus TaxID=2598579 RepID=A0A5C1AKC1_9BACT|nr:hypothetical protein [Limnoglobus roseus]QEL19661.1 hypothetical protein PX52LOC_06738 [Limnoglobus roseus]
MRFVPVAIVLLTAGSAQAGEPGRAYYRLSPDELTAQFTAGAATQPPAAAYRARVVWYENALVPRFRARVQSILFRGKTFADDGSFTNRFVGFSALPSQGRTDTSWVDGQPAYVLEYPLNYPLFGSYRDELREVVPGVWIGRVWNRTNGKSIGWFILSAP